MSSTAVTITAIVVPNVVAGTAIVTNWLQKQRELSAERWLTDLAHVRDVLDESAIALHQAAYALDELRSGLLQFGRGFFDEEDRSRPHRDAIDVGKRMDTLLERLKIRLGTHGVVAQFEKADEAMLAIVRTTNVLQLEPQVEEGDLSAARQVRELYDEKRNEIRTHREAFDTARTAFIEAAQQLAGAIFEPSDERLLEPSASQ